VQTAGHVTIDLSLQYVDELGSYAATKRHTVLYTRRINTMF